MNTQDILDCLGPSTRTACAPFAAAPSSPLGTGGGRLESCTAASG